MQTTRTIRSLMLATSLAAGVTLVSSSHDAFAGCAPRDHRTNCDTTINPNAGKANPPPPNPMWSPTVRLKNGRLVNYYNPTEHVTTGFNKDGTPIFDNVPTNIKIYMRVNKDGSVDRVEEVRRGDGPLEIGISDHKPPRPPKHADLCGNMLFGVCW